MPITKTYLNKKTVAQVRATATRKGISTKGKTKAQLVTAIMKKVGTGSNKTMKDGPVKGKYAIKYYPATEKYIIVYTTKLTSSAFVAGKRRKEAAEKAFKDRNFKKVAFKIKLG